MCLRHARRRPLKGGTHCMLVRLASAPVGRSFLAALGEGAALQWARLPCDSISGGCPLLRSCVTVCVHVHLPECGCWWPCRQRVLGYVWPVVGCMAGVCWCLAVVCSRQAAGVRFVQQGVDGGKQSLFANRGRGAAALEGPRCLQSSISCPDRWGSTKLFSGV